MPMLPITANTIETARFDRGSGPGTGSIGDRAGRAEPMGSGAGFGSSARRRSTTAAGVGGTCGDSAAVVDMTAGGGPGVMIGIGPV